MLKPIESSTQDAADAQRLIELVGQRVRDARQQHRWSRRELSERSGVSQRYLVQLENGEGNVSIGLLKRLSLALSIPVEALVTSDDLSVEEIARWIVAYRKADSTMRRRACDVLDPSGMQVRKAQRIALVGLRGAGKSTLGKALANTLQSPFIELNERIEARAGVPLSEVIALYGAEGYRSLEAEELQTLIESEQRCVLAVAGGIVSNADTYAYLLDACHTVWLQASPQEHMTRVAEQGDLRPIAGQPKAMEHLRHLLETRSASYARADLRLDTQGATEQQSLDALVTLIKAHPPLTPTLA